MEMRERGKGKQKKFCIYDDTNDMYVFFWLVHWSVSFHGGATHRELENKKIRI